MSNENFINKLKLLPDAVKQFGSLISIIILVILSKCAYDGCVFHIMHITSTKEEYAYYELVAIILEYYETYA